MTVVRLIKAKNYPEFLFYANQSRGWRCFLGPNEELHADIPDDQVQGELDAGRAVLIEEPPVHDGGI